MINVLEVTLCSKVLRTFKRTSSKMKNQTIAELMDSTNSSTNQTFTVSVWEKPVLLTLYCVTFVVSFCGNLAILLVFCKLRSQRVTNIFIGSLCVCDILMTVFCVPVTVVSDLIFLYWPFWAFLCPVVVFLQVFTVVQRSLILLTMTLHKHDSVWRPLQSHMKRRFAKLVIVAVWLMSFGAAVPAYIHSSVEFFDQEPGSNGLCIENWGNIESRRVYSLFLMTVQYLVPVGVMTLSYIHISYIIWAKKPPGEMDRKRDQRIASSKRRAVKLMMTVVIVYVICWLPLHTLTIIGDGDFNFFNERFVYFAWILSNWLAFSNSAVNPIVYFWMNSKYRQTLRQLFMSWCCKKRRSDSGLSYYTHRETLNREKRDTCVNFNYSGNWRNGGRYCSMKFQTSPVGKYKYSDTSITYNV